MKKLISALFISLALISCSKDSDDEDEGGDGSTFVNIVNNSIYPLPGVKIGSYTGNGQAKLIQNIGSIAVNEESGKIEIKDKNLTQIFIYFESDGDLYVFSHGHLISQGITNNLFMSSNGSASIVTESSFMYPK